MLDFSRNICHGGSQRHRGRFDRGGGSSLQRRASVSVSIDRISVPMEEPRPKRMRRRGWWNGFAGWLIAPLCEAEGEGRYTIRTAATPEGDIQGLRGKVGIQRCWLDSHIPRY